MASQPVIQIPPNLNASMEQTLKDFEVALKTKKPGTEEYERIEANMAVLRGVLQSLVPPAEESNESQSKNTSISLRHDHTTKDTNADRIPATSPKSNPRTKRELPTSVSFLEVDPSNGVPTSVENIVEEEKRGHGELEEYLEEKYGRRWDSYTSTSQIDDELLSQLSAGMREWIEKERCGARKMMEQMQLEREEEAKEREETERVQQEQKEKELQVYNAKVQAVESVKQQQERDASTSHLRSRSHTPSASSACNFDLQLIYPKQDELDAMSESSVSATLHSRSLSRPEYALGQISPHVAPQSPFLPMRQFPPDPRAHADNDDYPEIGAGPQRFVQPQRPNNRPTWRSLPSARYQLPPKTSNFVSYADTFKKHPRRPSPGYYGDGVFLEPDERRKRDAYGTHLGQHLASSTSHSGWDSFDNRTVTPELNLSASPNPLASPPNPPPTNAWFVNNDIPYVDGPPEKSKSGAPVDGLPVEVQVRSGRVHTPWKIGQRAFENVWNRMHGRQSERPRRQKQQLPTTRQQEQQRKNLLKWYEKRTSAQQLLKQQERSMALRSKQSRERHRRAMKKKEKLEEKKHAKANEHLVALTQRASETKQQMEEQEIQQNMRHLRAAEAKRKRHEKEKEKRIQKQAAMEAKMLKMERERERQKEEEAERCAEKLRAAEARKSQHLEEVKMSVEARTRQIEEVRTRKRKGSATSSGKKKKNRRKNKKRNKNKNNQRKSDIELDVTMTASTAPMEDFRASCTPSSDCEEIRRNIRRIIAQIQNDCRRADRKDHLKLHLGHEDEMGSDLVDKVRSLWHRTKSQVVLVVGRPESHVDFDEKVEHIPFDEDVLFEVFRDVSRSLQASDLDAMPLTCRCLALRCCVFVTYLPLYSLKTSRVLIETLVTVCQSQQGMEILLHRCSAQILEEFILQVQAYIRTHEPILRQKQIITGLTRIVCEMFSYSPPPTSSPEEIAACHTMQILLIRLLSSGTFWMKLGTACQRFIGSPPSPGLIKQKSGELIRLMRCGLVVLRCMRRYRDRIEEVDEFVSAFHSSNGGGMFWLLSNLVQCSGGDSNPPSIQCHLPQNFEISDEAVLVASCALEFLMEAALIRGELAQRLLLENEGESFHTLTILTQYCCSRFDLGSETLKQLTFKLVGFLGCCAFDNPTVQEMFQWGRTTNLIESLAAKMPFYFLNSFKGQMAMIPTLISVTYKCPTNLALLRKHLSVEHIVRFLGRFVEEEDPNVPAVLSHRYMASREDKEEMALRVPAEEWGRCVAFYQ